MSRVAPSKKRLNFKNLNNSTSILKPKADKSMIQETVVSSNYSTKMYSNNEHIRRPFHMPQCVLDTHQSFNMASSIID